MKKCQAQCYDCPNLMDQFGNYVYCPLLCRFVDYYYWTPLSGAPKDCPRNQEATTTTTEGSYEHD